MSPIKEEEEEKKYPIRKTKSNETLYQTPVIKSTHHDQKFIMNKSQTNLNSS